MRKEDSKGIVFNRHSIYGHVARSAVMPCTYNGSSFYLETREKKKKVFINKGDTLIVSPAEGKVEVYGRLGNFKDENGVYHAGKIEISPSDILVEKDVTLYSEEAISRGYGGWQKIGVSDEEAKKIKDLDPDIVDTKKNYEHFDGKEVKESIKSAGSKMIQNGISILKDIWN